MTHIEGSTRLLQRLGPGFAEVLFEHCEIIRAAAAAHDAQRQLGDHPWPTEDGVRVRMGQIEEIADTIVGLSVHEAARLSAAGHGGQVLASEAVVRLTATLTPRSRGSQFRAKNNKNCGWRHQAECRCVPRANDPLSVVVRGLAEQRARTPWPSPTGRREMPVEQVRRVHAGSAARREPSTSRQCDPRCNERTLESRSCTDVALGVAWGHPNLWVTRTLARH
jgi:hypothetical protein